MNFLIWRKNVLFSRYLDFCVFWNPQIAKSVTSSLASLLNGSYTFAYFFWILSTIKMKFGHILVYLITDISNMFLTQCWRLETNSRPFYDFNEMAILQELSIFRSWYLLFSIIPYWPFQKSITPETWHDWFLSNWSRLLNWKELRT